jgi:hypothetical protein
VKTSNLTYCKRVKLRPNIKIIKQHRNIDGIPDSEEHDITPRSIAENATGMTKETEIDDVEVGDSGLHCSRGGELTTAD